jgi:hypothetical protein
MTVILENNPLITALWTTISAAIGVGLKSVWDRFFKYHDDVRFGSWKLRTEELESRLSKFYWPLYVRLQRDNVVWNKILHRFDQEKENDDKRKIAFEIESSIIIPNHKEIVNIIENGIYLANLDAELEEQIMIYLRHVDVYTSARAVGILDKDPVYFGEPWPSGLFDIVKDRLNRYQSEYDSLLRDAGLFDLRGFRKLQSPLPMRISA